ncbi:MAG: hypothetical protein HY304_01375 [candidate division Zixibacteria bacterium]|nr:hypothetical protein [candidate division Zixibacteria bacterium]
MNDQDATLTGDGSGANLEALRTENARLRLENERTRTAHDYLVRLAHHFSGEEPSFESPEQIRAFCERIRRSVNLLVGEFKELLSGRKEVQNRWSLYSSSAEAEGQMSTREFRRGDLHGDLGRQLFDWKTSAPDDAATAGLKLAIDELKHHQLALLAGYERCVKAGTLAVLRPLAPEGICRDFLSGGKSPDRVTIASRLRALIPMRGWFLWRRYENRYCQLVSEDSHWFQSIFLPSFREGYRDYMLTVLEGRRGASRENRQGGQDGRIP